MNVRLEDLVIDYTDNKYKIHRAFVYMMRALDEQGTRIDTSFPTPEDVNDLAETLLNNPENIDPTLNPSLFIAAYCKLLRDHHADLEIKGTAARQLATGTIENGLQTLQNTGHPHSWQRARIVHNLMYLGNCYPEIQDTVANEIIGLTEPSARVASPMAIHSIKRTLTRRDELYQPAFERPIQNHDALAQPVPSVAGIPLELLRDITELAENIDALKAGRKKASGWFTRNTAANRLKEANKLEAEFLKKGAALKQWLQIHNRDAYLWLTTQVGSYGMNEGVLLCSFAQYQQHPGDYTPSAALPAIPAHRVPTPPPARVRVPVAAAPAPAPAPAPVAAPAPRSIEEKNLLSAMQAAGINIGTRSPQPIDETLPPSLTFFNKGPVNPRTLPMRARQTTPYMGERLDNLLLDVEAILEAAKVQPLAPIAVDLPQVAAVTAEDINAIVAAMSVTPAPAPVAPAPAPIAPAPAASALEGAGVGFLDSETGRLAVETVEDVIAPQAPATPAAQLPSVVRGAAPAAQLPPVVRATVEDDFDPLEPELEALANSTNGRVEMGEPERPISPMSMRTQTQLDKLSIAFEIERLKGEITALEWKAANLRDKKLRQLMKQQGSSTKAANLALITQEAIYKSDPVERELVNKQNALAGYQRQFQILDAAPTSRNAAPVAAPAPVAPVAAPAPVAPAGPRGAKHREIERLKREIESLKGKYQQRMEDLAAQYSGARFGGYRIGEEIMKLSNTPLVKELHTKEQTLAFLEGRPPEPAQTQIAAPPVVDRGVGQRVQQQAAARQAARQAREEAARQARAEEAAREEAARQARAEEAAREEVARIAAREEQPVTDDAIIAALTAPRP